MRSRPSRHRDREEPLLVRFALWVLKSALGGLAFVLIAVALANYQVILHHDGQVEFARKQAWTLADTFRFVGETSVAPPAPVLPAPTQIAAAPVAEPRPALLAQPGVVMPPAPAPVVAARPSPKPLAPSPKPQASRPRPIIARAPVPSDEDEEDDPEDAVRAVLSTARPHAVRPEPSDAGATECRTVRATLTRAVARLERERPGQRMTELRIFDLIEEGFLDQIVSCPGMGGLAIRRSRSGAEVRCTVHGPK